ncbi:immunoglobulin domain-containing protein, partial [Cohnella sp. WQ 127256]|uniref:beta strand repeat-containing protein n=1 Tax=Cohnella sp. WQ 127256 TaxID=2938790 RepID=UPI0021193236
MRKEINKSIAFFLFLFVIVFSVNPGNVYALPGGSGTGDGTYDFAGSLGATDSNGPGFRTLGNKWGVSNAVAVASPQLYSTNSTLGGAATTVLRAEGGAVNKTFTFKDLGISSYNSTRTLSAFTVVLKDITGTQIGAAKTLPGDYALTTSITQISTILNGGVPYNIDNVASITITAQYATSAQTDLNFENITVANINALIDTTAPTLSDVGTSVVTPNTLAATSNENGTLYLVLKSATITNQASLDAEVSGSRGKSVAATAASAAAIPTTGLTAGTYAVYAVDAAGNVSAASADVTLTNPDITAPSITSHPSASTIAAGANTTFSVTASNATGYQWQVDQGAGFANISNGAPYSGATTSTLTITGATAGMNGYLYRVVATGLAAPAATSNSAALTVNPPPSITSHPSASTIAAGANTTFSVTASNATGYQWQVNTGAGFTNIANGAPYSGATTATLTITGATAGMNGYLYRVVATGLATPNATSNSVSLTVNSPPSITSHPSASTIAAGANTTFSVTASNATGYQWQVDQGAGFTSISNGAPYSGATTSTLTITGATAGMNGYLYRVVATGAATPNAVSNSAALTVNSPPSITSHPSNSTIAAGANTTFSVTASNATGYQWQVDQGAGFTNIVNGAPYSGATSSTLTITGATAGMNGYLYRVVVIGVATGMATLSTTSNIAALTVNPPPSITSQPSASTIAAGANTTFSVTASNAMGYQWQVDQGAGFTNIANGAPYSGATTATLTITGATAGMNGYLYRVVATGLATPAATSNIAALTVNPPPSITSQPSASTIAAGANTTFSVTASNATGYQWQVDQGAGFANISNGAPYSGATTSTLTITGATAG